MKMSKSGNGNSARRFKFFKPRIGKGDYGCTEFIGTAIAYKSSWQAEACGTVDELNAIIGEAHSRIENTQMRGVLLTLSKDLFTLGTDIANTILTDKTLPRVSTKHVHHLEDLLAHYEKSLAKINHFVVPIGPPSVTILNQARAVCRRAERQMVRFMRGDKTGLRTNPLTLAYLNRLGDLLFVMSRYALKETKTPELHWSRKDASDNS